VLDSQEEDSTILLKSPCIEFLLSLPCTLRRSLEFLYRVGNKNGVMPLVCPSICNFLLLPKARGLKIGRYISQMDGSKIFNQIFDILSRSMRYSSSKLCGELRSHLVILIFFNIQKVSKLDFLQMIAFFNHPWPKK